MFSTMCKVHTYPTIPGTSGRYMEPLRRIELRAAVYKTAALPLSERGRLLNKVLLGLEFSIPNQGGVHQSLNPESNWEYFFTREMCYHYTIEAITTFYKPGSVIDQHLPSPPTRLSQGDKSLRLLDVAPKPLAATF